MDKTGVESRFWSQVEKGKACWRWTGTVNKAGYGVFWTDGTLHYAHRWAFLALVGDVKRGESVYRTCGSRLCVNPDHMTTEKPIPKRGIEYKVPKRGRKGNFRLSDAQVGAIRAVYATGNVTQATIARKYRVSQAQVSRITSEVQWNSVY